MEHIKYFVHFNFYSMNTVLSYILETWQRGLLCHDIEALYHNNVSKIIKIKCLLLCVS
jgi:hypothetical protein